MNDKNVGRRIQLARKAAGYSCLEVADKCYINVGYIRQIEAGAIPSLHLLIQLCDLLSTSQDYLLGYAVGINSEENMLFKKICKLKPEEMKLCICLLDKYFEYDERDIV